MSPASVATAKSPRLVVTLCTYNERENIARLVPQVLEQLPLADVLVVDDNSPDGTADVVRQLMSTDSRVKLLLRTKKEGLGAATLAGFQWAVDHDYDFVQNMDADFSHHPRYLPALSECMQFADVGIGSRYVPGGSITGWSPLRHFMSQAINWYSHILLGLKAKDCSGAFRCYRMCEKQLQYRRNTNHLRRSDCWPIQDQHRRGRSFASRSVPARPRRNPGNPCHPRCAVPRRATYDDQIQFKQHACQ